MEIAHDDMYIPYIPHRAWRLARGILNDPGIGAVMFLS
jgi:hypothetical protein